MLKLQFETMCIVQHRALRVPSSLKCTLHKSAGMPAQAHVKQEKHLIAGCDSPFLVRLVAGFQDSAYLYMLLEAAMGGEFFMYMQVT